MSSDGGPTFSVKLFIDKEKKKVLFAESDKDFVDVLFSFLTLPLGTIVRLFDKKSQVGCLDELYKSVESLGEDHFQTKACKAMLLAPLNAAAVHCNRLKVKVVDKNPMYRCKNASCRVTAFSSVPHAICYCKNDAVFVIGVAKFIITDDLQVAPASTRVMFSLIEKYGIPEKENIQEKVIQLNSAKMIGLLRRALLTKQVLTGLYFDVAILANPADMCMLSESMFAKQALETEPKFKAIKDGPMNFMVTDDLQIRPFCLINTLEFLRACKVPKDKLVEKELTLNKTQVLKLVGAAFGTSKALSSVLMPSKK
ncbi:uncharacterized protein [Triticum aestivum]|uniref:uncharacterized protein n=1 Tax=Triticum aestivum TaxID=4565 RepID=UPI001D009F75|nr:uncharacterized protein LOC123191979 [Triticum aestivum]